MKKVNNNLDTPTIINSIVDFLQDPNCKKMHETFEKTKDPAAILNSAQGAEVSGFHTTTGSSFLANQGGTVTIINPANFIRLPADAVAATTDGNIPVVVKEAVAEVRDEQQLPLSVVQASRKRTIMTRSLSRQASQVAEVKEEVEEEEDSDSDYTPEPVAKKSRASNAGPSSSSRMRSTAGRKPNSAKGDGLEHLPPDERDKVRMRRQKNKEAAARCRQKRVDLTNSLAKQVEEEQASKAKLQQEIRRLRQEQDKLRRQLEAHKAYGCNMITEAGAAPPVTTTQASYHHVAAAAAPVAVVPVAVKSQPVIVEAANAPYTTAVSLSSHTAAAHQPLTKPRRPQTLGLSQQQQLTTAAAVTSDKAQIKLEEQLETPSKMIAPLFDGFTPTSIFGNIPTLGTPTACSVQQLHRAGAACDDLTTPSDLTCSLTAL